MATVRHSALAPEPGRSLLTGADVAVPFFLVNYAGAGRRLAAARGFYETLIPAYTSQAFDSPLSLAVEAVAARIFSIWRSDDTVEAAYLAPYTRAVASLRSTLKHSDDHGRPTTALAVLALHLYESISAVYGARRPTSVHHHGALSLLPNATLNSLDSGLVGTYVKGFVLHTEISSALRQKRPMHPDAYSHLNSARGFFSAPNNFSSKLDSIGARIAQLQADYVRELSGQHIPQISLLKICESWVEEAGHIEQLLLVWAQEVPGYWRPLRVAHAHDFDQSIPAYQSACDIYPSCQVATLWNLWRFHRLLLLKISIGARRILSLSGEQFASDFEERRTLTVEECVSDVQASCIQELINGICHSVPFYLGNRTDQCSLRDFADQDISFPSYHSLKTETNVMFGKWQQHQTQYKAGIDDGDNVLSEDEHHRHMIAYGAWHILSPLSNLLTMFSDDHGGRSVASCIHAAQQEWIRQQFLRVSIVLGLPRAGQVGRCDGAHHSRSSAGTDSSDSGVAELTRQVREGTELMSVP